MTMARRAASSAAAITRTLHRRLALLSDARARAGPIVAAVEEADDADDVEADAVLGAQGLNDAAEERTAVESLIALAARCRISSKIRRLHRLLSLAREPVVVFTEYRDTLNAIVDSLRASSQRVIAIHGGLASDMRRDAVDAFNAGSRRRARGDRCGRRGTEPASSLQAGHRCRAAVEIRCGSSSALAASIGSGSDASCTRFACFIRRRSKARCWITSAFGCTAPKTRSIGPSTTPTSPPRSSKARRSSRALRRCLQPRLSRPPGKHAGSKNNGGSAVWRPQQKEFGRRRASVCDRSSRSIVCLSSMSRHVVSEQLLATRIALRRYPENQHQWRRLIADVESIVARPGFEAVRRRRRSSVGSARSARA
jgi:hypothetical protein